MSGVTPPGYETFAEACRRAWETWSSDNRSHLKGLLLAGQLKAWKVNKSGNVELIEKVFWESREGIALFEGSQSEIVNPPVFLREDLRRGIPSVFERLERRAAEKRAKKSEAALHAGAEKNKGGRPISLDWDAMWIEIVRMVWFDAFEEDRKELQKQIKSWFVKSGRAPPTESVLRAKMKDLFDMIDRENRKG
jgi:hypothetical protein